MRKSVKGSTIQHRSGIIYIYNLSNWGQNIRHPLRVRACVAEWLAPNGGSGHA